MIIFYFNYLRRHYNTEHHYCKKMNYYSTLLIYIDNLLFAFLIIKQMLLLKNIFMSWNYLAHEDSNYFSAELALK